MRRIIDNVAGVRPTRSRMQLHASQYGCVCPVESPSGRKVGLNKGLAIISHITFGCKTQPILQFVINEGAELIDDLMPLEIQQLCKIFINGNWIGCHRNPLYLYNICLLYRRNGLINVFISITWERATNEIIIFTDGGRFVRPLYIVENNNILLQPKHIKDINAKVLTFTDLVSGFAKRTSEYNYYNDELEHISSIGIHKKDNLYIESMRNTQAIIEYVDCQEFDTCMLSIGFNISPTNLQKFTHVELHPPW